MTFKEILKMKITSSRYDEIVKQRDEYAAKMDELNNRVKESWSKYYEASAVKQKELEQKISDIIGPTSLDLIIRADSDLLSSGNWVWSIHVNVNENKLFDEKSALSWSWQVKLNRAGEIIKDSSSWSGLKAVTAEQIENLEESVRVIKILNNIDWSPLLHAPHPSTRDYIDDEASSELRDLESNRPDFESQLTAEYLSELVGTDTAVKLSSDEMWRGPVWMLVTGLTDKFVKGYIFPEFYLRDNPTADELKAKVDERRAAKSKLVKERDGSLVTYSLSEEDFEE